MFVTVTACHIDYAALLRVVSPNAGRVLGLLPQSALGTMAVQAINAGQEPLCRRMEQLAAEKGLALTLDGLEARSLSEDRLQVTLGLGQVGLAGIAERLLPAAQRALWRSDRLAFLGDALGREPDAYTQGVQAIWDALSDAEQERLLDQALKAYQAPLLRALNALAREKGLSLEAEKLAGGRPKE